MFPFNDVIMILGNIKLYLYFPSFLNAEAVQVINPWTTITHLSYTVNIIAADGKAMQGARPVAIMALTLFSRDILVSASTGLNLKRLERFSFKMTNNQSVNP